MNAEVLISAAAIFITIIIATYVMNRYRADRGKRKAGKKSTGQEKKYMIKAPDILKAGLPCGCFAGLVNIIFILSQVYDWKYVGQIDEIIFFVICFSTFTGFMLLGIILACYGYIWKIEFDESGIIYRSALGVTKRFRLEDITRYTEKRRRKYKFYQGDKRLFQYETDAMGDVYELPILLKRLGITGEELIPSDRDHCIVEPMAVQKALPILGAIGYGVFLIILIVSGDGKLWMYLLLGGVFLSTIYYTGSYLCHKTEVKDKIYRKEFLKKTRSVEFSQITDVKEYKSKADKEYLIINIKDGKPIKIRKHNENINILMDRLNDERKHFASYGKKKTHL